MTQKNIDRAFSSHPYIHSCHLSCVNNFRKDKRIQECYYTVINVTTTASTNVAMAV